MFINFFLKKRNKVDVLVDARCIEWGNGGVSRILTHVLKRWHNERKENVTLLFQSSIPEHVYLGFPNFKYHLLKGPKFITKYRILSEQILIPFVLFLYKPRIFFSTWYTAPIFIGKTQLVLGLWDISFSTHPEHYRYIHRFSLGFFSRLSAKMAHTIITCSDYDASQINHYYNIPLKKIHIWYITADERFFVKVNNNVIEEFHSKMKIPNRFILSLGVIYNRRHVDYLINAFYSFSNHHPEVYLIIVGKDVTNPKQNIQELCNTVSDKIIYLEHIEDKYLPVIYQAADVFYCVSSVDGETLLIKEALAGATPVLTSKLLIHSIGGFCNLIEDPQDSESIKQALIQFYNNLSEAKKSALLGQSYVRKISWTNVTDDSLNVFW